MQDVQTENPYSLSRMIRAAALSSGITRTEWIRASGVVPDARVSQRSLMHRATRPNGPQPSWVVPMLEHLGASPEVALYELAQRTNLTADDARALAVSMTLDGAKVGRLPSVLRMKRADALTLCARAAAADVSDHLRACVEAGRRARMDGDWRNVPNKG